jgi:hypothetical protein
VLDVVGIGSVDQHEVDLNCSLVLAALTIGSLDTFDVGDVQLGLLIVRIAERPRRHRGQGDGAQQYAHDH